MNKDKLKAFIYFTILLSIAIISLFYENKSIEVVEQSLQAKNYHDVIRLSDELLEDPRLDMNDRKRIYIYKAISEYSLNQELNAKITFLKLMSIDEDSRIESAYVSPNVIEFFDKLKNQYIFYQEPKNSDLGTVEKTE